MKKKKMLQKGHTIKFTFFKGKVSFDLRAFLIVKQQEKKKDEINFGMDARL